MKRGNPFSQEIILINGKMYRVEDYPSKETIEQKHEQAFKKGFAYRYRTSLQQRIYPYLGIIEDPKDLSMSTSPVGIYYVRHGKILIQRVVFPRTKKEAEIYALENERSVMSAVSDAYKRNQFADAVMSAGDAGLFSFIPPMHADDYMLNRTIKFAIRLKDAPFEPYGKRLETLAVEKGHGMEGTNIKNNGKRGLRLNRAMSASKAMQFAETWQLDLALLVTDQPDAMHPISENGEIYIYYPFGKAFKVDPDKLVDIGPMIEQAIINDKNREDDSDD